MNEFTLNSTENFQQTNVAIAIAFAGLLLLLFCRAGTKCTDRKFILKGNYFKESNKILDKIISALTHAWQSRSLNKELSLNIVIFKS